ncbi:MAG: aspartyl/glutamyl-tRNA amidotransferase subunit C [Gemmatimonadota bacterium]|nr:aspartyl/glutamyl-tRNA amidotransferase subunit C [Gemmatimonadota bacterium]
MSIGRDEVLHAARLAALDVQEDELPQLVAQMGRIVNFVAQLGEVPASEAAPPFHAGPDHVALRADVVAPTPLTRTPAEMAPEFREGLFVVPRLGAMEGTE